MLKLIFSKRTGEAVKIAGCCWYCTFKHNNYKDVLLVIVGKPSNQIHIDFDNSKCKYIKRHIPKKIRDRFQEFVNDPFFEIEVNKMRQEENNRINKNDA